MIYLNYLINLAVRVAKIAYWVNEKEYLEGIKKLYKYPLIVLKRGCSVIYLRCILKID